MPHQLIKRIGNLFGGLVLACCCFFGYYIMSASSNKQLKDFKKEMDTVIMKKEVTRTSSTAKGSIQLKGFELNLKHSNKIFRYYNISQEYSLVDSKIKTGDFVTIYYEQNSKDYVDVAQIEKGGSEVVRVADFRKRSNMGRFIAFAGGLLLLVMTIYSDAKHWKK